MEGFTKNILIIDDNDAINYFNELMLRSSNKVDGVKSVTSCDKGLLYINRLKQEGKELPDVILLDINMPRMTGWEFCEILKSTQILDQKKTHVYILTNSLSDTDFSQSKNLNFVHGYIKKPLTKNNLSTFL
ncbi:MAG: CheY-like chemotaxis protein [Sphingobacteriales bacterium]|jgi:CheY-like chemotaxis protein